MTLSPTRKNVSAGLLLFRRRAVGLEVLLGHPGGPYWSKKDAGSWSIPKGLLADEQGPLMAAKREFAEETGYAPEGEFVPLGEARQPGGKLVVIFAMEGDWDVSKLRSNMFSMEWPPKSGTMREFPELDRTQWFPLEVALEKILKGQAVFLVRLSDAIAS